MENREVALLDPQDVRQTIEDALPLILSFNLVPFDDPLHSRRSKAGRIIAGSREAINIFFFA